MKLWQLLLAVAVLGPLFASVGLLWLWIRLTGGAKRRSPLTQDLLRSPGESLGEQLEDNSWDLATYFGMSSFPVLAAYGYYMSYLAFEGHAPGIGAVVIVGATVLVGQGWILWKIWTILKKRRSLRLGYEAELAVGQELHQLARRGYHVFHDVPADKFNVDHVIVGPNGVFAIETKGRPKPLSSPNGKAGWEVGYDGSKLEFPGWRETRPLEQAVRQAKWVRDWLRKELREEIPVRPV